MFFQNNFPFSTKYCDDSRWWRSSYPRVADGRNCAPQTADGHSLFPRHIFIHSGSHFQSNIPKRNPALCRLRATSCCLTRRLSAWLTAVRNASATQCFCDDEWALLVSGAPPPDFRMNQIDWIKSHHYPDDNQLLRGQNESHSADKMAVISGLSAWEFILSMQIMTMQWWTCRLWLIL